MSVIYTKEQQASDGGRFHNSGFAAKNNKRMPCFIIFRWISICLLLAVVFWGIGFEFIMSQAVLLL